MRSVPGSGRSRWVVGGLAFALGLAGLLIFFAFGSTERLDRADQLASIGGLVVDRTGGACRVGEVVGPALPVIVSSHDHRNCRQKLQFGNFHRQFR